MTSITPVWKVPMMDSAPQHIFCAQSTSSSTALGLAAVTSGQFHLRARHSGLYCRVAVLPQYSNVRGITCDLQDAMSAAAFSYSGSALQFAGRAMHVPAAADSPLVDASVGGGLAAAARAGTQILALSLAGAQEAWAPVSPAIWLCTPLG